MSSNPPTPAAAKPPVRLLIRKGSIAMPLALLLVTVVLFIVHGLPSGFEQIGTNFGIAYSAKDPMTLDKMMTAIQAEDSQAKIMTALDSFGPLEFFTKIALPMAKVYVDQLIKDLGGIAQNSLLTILQLSLYSLIPGIAGLIYRRNFLRWFLVSFAVLLGINASGLFGTLTTAKPMPGSGAVFFFVLSQIVILILAFRLKRQAKSLNLLPPKVHNWVLAGVLLLVAVLCWQGIGPGYRWGSAAPANTVAAVNSSGTETPELAVSQADAPAVTPAVTPKVEPLPDNNGPRRSWIWGFFGSGLIGWFYRWEFILLGLPLVYSLLRNSAAWTAQSPKNIVLCLDGTSNTPDQMEMGFLAQTNVFKLFNMLKADKAGMAVPSGKFDASLSKTYGNKQVALYYAGVGNKYESDAVLQTLGLATGMGAADIVQRAYLDLVRVYRPGDRVFIFGFSRGAAIARLLARTIDARGAPRSLWTLRLFGKHRRLWTSARRQPVPIDVLGCFDTVGSFGIAKTISGINFQQLNLFKDLTIPDNVAQAYHMLALDEQRDSFEPTLMDPDPIRPERIVEVWFSGDHANIGGGWATDKLSDITLDFLLGHVSSGYARDPSMTAGDERWGLYLSAVKANKTGPSKTGPAAISGLDDVIAVDPDPLGQVRHWFSNLYQYRPRKLPLHAVISDTVFARMKTSIPVYAPQSLFDLNDALNAKRGLIEANVAKLTETRSLEETERQAMLDFKDRLRLTRWPQYWDSIVAARTPGALDVVLSNAEHGAAELPT